MPLARNAFVRFHYVTVRQSEMLTWVMHDVISSSLGFGNLTALAVPYETVEQFQRRCEESGRGLTASWLKRKQDAGEDIDKYLV